MREGTMLIRHLDYFITLTEERHFGRAADLCGVSQPALSLAIRKLEEDLATPLIIRGQRFMGLTAEGEKLKIWGQRILADYGNLRDDLTGRRRGGLSGLLRLGVAAAAMPLATAISARFEARNPMARISIANLPAEEISRGVSDQSLDGGLTWLAPITPLPRGGRLACAMR
jgi:DNA-binding transcriptional LysR family regulator